MSNGNREPMKIVIINTQYVETDAVNFKSVVQRLTGKDSTAADEPRSKEGSLSRKATMTRLEEIRSGGRMPRTGRNSVLSRGVSFKDFDRLLKELPPFDELYQIFAD